MSDKFKIIRSEEEFWDCMERKAQLEIECILEPDKNKQEEILHLQVMIDMWEYRQEIREIEASGDYDIDPHTEWKRRWNERLKREMFEELEREAWEEELKERLAEENGKDSATDF